MFIYRIFQSFTKGDTLLEKMISQSLENNTNECDSKSEISFETKGADQIVDYYSNSYYSYDIDSYSYNEFPQFDIYLEPESNYLLSVIYHCESNLRVIREQITCLSNVISTSISPIKYRYEFICLVDSNEEEKYEKLKKMSRELCAIRPFIVRNSSQREHFFIGSLYSRGRILIDARFLANEIDFLLTLPMDKKYIKCIFPENNSPLVDFLPIIATKNVVWSVFTKIHVVQIGCFAELELLSFRNQVQIETMEYPYIQICYPAIRKIFGQVISFLIMKMYWYGFWTM